MRAFAIYRGDGDVVGIVTTESDDAPPVVKTGNPDEIVTEIETSDVAVALSGREAETRALEALQGFRLERRLIKRSENTSSDG
jgi:hypothetical protein